MHQIGKFHRVLNEKDWNVVADQIPVTFVCVEFNGESSHIARCIRGAPFSNHCREAHEDRRPFACLGEEGRTRLFF